ncbi:MAG: YbhB/YbcL family Raf kinase inhibitor-like protein [Candidatus Lokiarchaeota archaeon]|nr:YbhB/YbcL family Raf kinase inhibitor-like protein [Candidatus Lokiarchaeota archaeon]
MKLESNDFRNNEMIDKKFTCQGENISPHLKWEDVPENTKSFAISCEDPDVSSDIWIHWYICDIPLNQREIPQGGPVLGSIIKNDFTELNYSGPCPPKGIHHYIFTIYALSKKKLHNVDTSNFKNLINNYTIEKSELVGLYKKQ